MAEEVKPDGLVTRAARTFKNSKTLQHATLAVGFAAGAIGLGHVAAKPKDDLEHVKSVGAVAIKPAVDPYGAGADIIKMTGDAMLPHLQQVQNPSNGVKIETVEAKEDSVDGVIDIFYPGTTGENRKKLRDQIIITKLFLRGDENFPGILVPESYQNIEDHRQLFDDIEAYAGVPHEVMIGLACTESRAGVDLISDAGAVGPFQIGDDMWTDAGNVASRDENDGRLNWDESAKFTAAELAKRNQYFASTKKPNWGIPTWSWHIGFEGMKALIEDVSANRADTFNNFRKYIEEHQITAATVLDIENIRLELEKPSWDSTELYVVREAACASIMEDMKNYELKNASNQD